MTLKQEIDFTEKEIERLTSKIEKNSKINNISWKISIGSLILGLIIAWLFEKIAFIESIGLFFIGLGIVIGIIIVNFTWIKSSILRAKLKDEISDLKEYKSKVKYG
jgi:amino acid transporter